MRLQHRGLTIELPEDDPRIAVIEALLFGRTLPPPFAPPPEPVVAPPPQPPPPPPPPPPPVVVPAAYRAFWRALGPVERRELALLAEREHSPAEMEKALGLRQSKLMGRHSVINRLAFKHDTPGWIFSRGRGRDARRFYVRKDVVPFIRALVAAPPADD